MIIVLLCLTSCIVGALVGWFARELRDILAATLEIYKKLHYHNNRTAKSAVITGGHVFTGGQEQPNGEIVLQSFDPDAEPTPKPKSVVLRSMSPKDMAKLKERQHKDDLAAGKN